MDRYAMFEIARRDVFMTGKAVISNLLFGHSSSYPNTVLCINQRTKLVVECIERCAGNGRMPKCEKKCGDAPSPKTTPEWLTDTRQAPSVSNDTSFSWGEIVKIRTALAEKGEYVLETPFGAPYRSSGNRSHNAS
jgi:hypothetical protein